LVADTGKCLLGSSSLYDMRKSTVDSITDEACHKLLLELEVKSCVDAYTMDNVIQFNIS
jgi:RNA 3'-terminal phosphate cyclase